MSSVQSGSLVLDVQNPFGVAISATMEIGGPGITTLQRVLNIGSGPTSSATLLFTGLELRSFLGKPGVIRHRLITRRTCDRYRDSRGGDGSQD